MDLFETVTWVKFNKPGLKEEVVELGKQSNNVDDFRDKLRQKYNIDLSMAYTLSRKFYKPKEQ